jgi:hypothetical protein
MPTVLPFPARAARPALRTPEQPPAPPGRAGWLELLAAACAGLLPGEARLEAVLDRIEALP